MRNRPHIAAAAVARPRRPRSGAVYRRGAVRHDAGALSPRGRHLVAIPMACHGPDPRQCARRVRRAPELLRHRTRPGRRSVYVPAGRSPRAAHVRELPGPAACPPRPAPGALGKPQSVRADDAIRGADASAAARRHVAIRGDAPPAARAAPRSPISSRRRSTATSRRRQTTAIT